MPSKSPKGTVSVVTQDNMLRLRWRIDGKRYVLPLGLADTPLHRRIALGKAAEIQADVAFERFDRTLRKYQGEATTAIGTAELFGDFIAHRIAQGTSERTAEKHRAVLANLKRFNLEIDSTTKAKRFIELLRSRQSALIANQNLSMLKAFGEWAVQREIWPSNHFEPISPAKGARQARDGEPFTRAEIRLFLDTIKVDRYYAHYHDVCMFLFYTGCRPSEAHDLTWPQVNFTKGTVTIYGTKTDHTHQLQLQPQLLQMLRARRSFFTTLVFPAPKGGRINTHSFSQRCWRSVCASAGIPYRVPYFARHSLASHLIAEGASYPQTAYVLGHRSTRMVVQTYGRMIDPPKMPEF